MGMQRATLKRGEKKNVLMCRMQLCEKGGAMRMMAWLREIAMVGLAVMIAGGWMAARAQGNSAQGTLPGPLPAQIVNAKSVFISNTAPDGMPSDILEHFGEPNRPYDQLYATMKAWGRYELAGAPADADLVVELHFTRSFATGGIGEGAELYVSILDTKTHFVLWTLVEPVEAAVRKATWEKNIDASVRAIVNDMKVIGGTGAQQ
jgi:hypothetical protein